MGNSGNVLIPQETRSGDDVNKLNKYANTGSNSSRSCSGVTPYPCNPSLTGPRRNMTTSSNVRVAVCKHTELQTTQREWNKQCKLSPEPDWPPDVHGMQR
jgi:hypothetical protein